MAATREIELLRRQLEELNARIDEVRQQSANALMNAAVMGISEAVRTMGADGIESAPRGHESREARAVRTWHRLR